MLLRQISIKGNTPMTVKFSCGVSGKPTSYTWIINKQTIKGDARGRVAYTFTKPGVYDVTLLVKDASGHTDKMTKKAFIRVLPKVHRCVSTKSSSETGRTTSGSLSDRTNLTLDNGSYNGGTPLTEFLKQIRDFIYL